MWRRHHHRPAGAGKKSGLLHVPQMRLLEMCGAFRGEDLKGGEAKVAHIVHGPAVAGVSLDVTSGSRPPGLQACLELLEDDAPRRRPLHGRRSEVKRRGGRDSDGSVLLDKELLCLGRPRHELAIETEPARAERIPQTGLGECSLNDVEKLPLQLAAGKHRPSGSRVANPDASAGRLAESIYRRLLIAADDDDGPRSHVL